MLPFEVWERQAKLMGVPRDWIIHEFFQRLILFTLYSDLDISWTFHGGTALHFFYDSPRFSLDLDFTGSLSEKEYDILLDKIHSHIETYSTLLGISTKITSVKYYSERPEMLRFFVVFSSKSFFKRFRIKLEILNKFFERYVMKDLLLEMPIRSIAYIKVKNLSDILIDKICSFAGRPYFPFTDIFDIWFIRRQGVNINPKVLLSEFGLWRETPESLNARINELSRLPISDILTKINDFLPNKSKLSSVLAENMRKVVLDVLKSALSVLKDEKNYTREMD